MPDQSGHCRTPSRILRMPELTRINRLCQKAPVMPSDDRLMWYSIGIWRPYGNSYSTFSPL
ncbi:hypothetical protein GUC30_24810 [Escherichia coli]|nr:hypothetical protein [Escherichia coli]